MPELLQGAAPRSRSLDRCSPPPDVVPPGHHEEPAREPCLRRLHASLAQLPWSFRITVAENASIDGTLRIAQRVAAELPGIEVRVLLEPGRGRALRDVWLASDSPVLVYVEGGLSPD